MLFTYYIQQELSFTSKIMSWVHKPVGIKHEAFKCILLSITNNTDFHNKCCRDENIQIWNQVRKQTNLDK